MLTVASPLHIPNILQRPRRQHLVAGCGHRHVVKNRERLLNEKALVVFPETLMGKREVKLLLSNEHFSVDGTLLQAWTSHGSLKRVDGNDPEHTDCWHSGSPRIAKSSFLAGSGISLNPLKT